MSQKPRDKHRDEKRFVLLTRSGIAIEQSSRRLFTRGKYVSCKGLSPFLLEDTGFKKNGLRVMQETDVLTSEARAELRRTPKFARGE